MNFKSLIAHHQFQYPINWREQFGRSAPLEVEIGFGLGEVLFKKAQEFPKRNFIGFEQNWERICRTLQQIDTVPSIQNVRLLKVDARIAFERFFKEKSIDTIYSLFPCPWPKKAHIKHRLFSCDFLKLLNSRLKNSGALKIVTDHEDYFHWILDQADDTGFAIQKNKISPRYNTKFERKWLLKGQEKFFEINFSKKRHVSISIKKELKLKSYSLKNFHFDRFRMEKETGEISVILKDFLYDPKKYKGMAHVVVVEDYMIQHFWIAIVKKGKAWHVGRADGQSFFQTPGINRSIELVYQAALKTIESPTP